MRSYLLIFPVLLSLLLAGCPDTSAPAKAVGHTSFKVTLSSDTGSAESRLDLDRNFKVKLSIEARDEQNDLMKKYDGKVRIKVKPGIFTERNTGDLHLDMDPGSVELEIEDGKATDIELEIERSMGNAVIWVEDIDTFVSGVSETIYLKKITLAGAQYPNHKAEVVESTQGTNLCEKYETLGIAPPPDTSVWEYNAVRIETGSLIVTHSQIGGFYLTDTDEPDFGSIYVYTRGIPALERGDRLTYLSGNISEFFGLTELTFPSYAVECSHHALPEPVLINSAMLDCEMEMEKYEGGLVRIDGVSPSKEIDDESYLNYGQWMAYKPDGGQISLSTEVAMPGYDPRSQEAKGKVIQSITGILRHHYSADPEWILVPRDECDVVCDFSFEGYDCAQPSWCKESMPQTNCE